jgi:hypothetical protein
MNVIYDIESFPNFFFYGHYDYIKDIYESYEISDRKNDYLKIKERLLRGDIDYQIGFNNIEYDYILIDFLLSRNFTKLSGSELSLVLNNLSQKIIKRNDEIRSIAPWKEKIKQLDLKKIWHFDNKAKLVSLKWIQFMIDWYNLEELPFNPELKLTDEQKDKVITYWYNDIKSTYEFFKITRGNTDLSLYKGKDKIALRKDVIKRFNIQCHNFNDVKIGETLLKKDYCKAEGLEFKDLKYLKPLNKVEKFKVKDFVADYVTFKTKKFQDFFNIVKETEIELGLKDDNEEKEKIYFNFEHNGTTYNIAKGGIHSIDKPRLIIPLENEMLEDCDVGSQYPNSIAKRRLKPRHLTESWLKNILNYIQFRIEEKKLFKENKNPVHKSFDETFKLSLNGGSFGKLGEEFNWQRDYYTLMCVTFGNQFEILMLIEMFETNGIHVVSANTDGVVSLFDKSLKPVYDKVCNEWEQIVGNSVNGKLEFTNYKLFAQTSVNDYIAITSKNEIKKKGDFLTDFDIHKNKSKRIIPIALEAYYVNGIKPEVTITNHTNIFDFCAAVKGTGESKFYLVDLKTGNKQKIQKINRFYLSNSNTIMIKEMPPLESKKPSYQIDIFGSVDNGERISRIETESCVTLFNHTSEIEVNTKNIKEYNINYKYYIDKCYEIINKIKNE